LVERRLKGPWINLKKQLALPYEGSFLVIPSEQIACDLRLNVGIHLSSQGTDPFAVKVNILLLDLGHHDFRGRCRSRAGRMFRAQGPNYQCNDDQTNHFPPTTKPCLRRLFMAYLSNRNSAGYFLGLSNSRTCPAKGIVQRALAKEQTCSNEGRSY